MTLVSRLERDAHLATQTHSPADALLRHAVDLSHHNTMALTCSADTVITLHDEAQIDALMVDKTAAIKERPLLILSGGSNVLLPAKLDAVVLQPMMRGINVVAQTDSYIDIEVMISC